MPKPPEGRGVPPITIPWFATGLYTYRNPLFAPIRSLGVNIVQYHDALIGGQDMEVTDLLEVQRRPGYSQFCSVQLGGSEIVNQFYSFRSIAGQVLPFFDSNQRWALFGTSSITTLLNKSAGAGQGFPYTVGAMTYYADGADYMKLDKYGNVTPWGIAAPTTTPTVSGTGYWQPGQTVVLNQAIIDPNGNVQVSSGGVATAVTIYASGYNNVTAASVPTTELSGRGQGLTLNITANGGGQVTGATIANGGIGYLVGNYVVIGSLSTLQWAILQVSSVSGASQTGVTGQIEPQWSSALSSVTRDGSVTWINYGPVTQWNPGSTFTFPSSIVDPNGNLQIIASQTSVALWQSGVAYTQGQVVFWAGGYWTCNANNTGNGPGQVGLSSTNQTPYWLATSNPVTSGLSSPSWNATFAGTTTDGGYVWQNCGPGYALAQAGYQYCYALRTLYGDLSTASPQTTSTGPILGPQPSSITAFQITGNVVTFQAINNFQSGTVFQLTGLSTGTYLNDVALTVIAAGLSGTQFSANFTHANAGPTNDSGTASPQIAQLVGPGLTNALCNATPTITAVSITGNIVTLTVGSMTIPFSPGCYVTLTGLGTATFLNGLQFQVLFATPTQIQVVFQHANYAQAADTGTVTFNAIEIYRTADGGGIYYAAGALTNPGAGNTWTFNDFTPDQTTSNVIAGLNTAFIAPLAHVNDPPPGASGSLAPTQSPALFGSLMTYWQGRLWMAAGNYVYFDAGPDCLNGNPRSCWPPSYCFIFSGPVFGLIPTEGGLEVWLADRVALILGGPQTASFYSDDWLNKVGCAGYNAIERDGQDVYVLTTQGQFRKISRRANEHSGAYVADVIQSTFPPAGSYVTVHRQGQDDGAYVFDGSLSQLRLGLNIPAWSPLGKPVGGIGAARSIETSVGVYSLMMAPATGGGFLGARNFTNYQDFGQNYALCQAVVGSIQLSTAGAPLMNVQHIVLYCSAVGTLTNGGPSVPAVAILPNELSPAGNIPWLNIPTPVSEPPTGATPSSTIQQLRYPVNTMAPGGLASQFMHHLQVQITFQPENAPNSIKQLAIKEDQQ